MGADENHDLPATWERRKRSLHIVDIENLVGDTHQAGDRYDFEHALASYAAAATMRPQDQVLLGCHPGLIFTAQKILGSRGRIFTGAGADGADLALLRASDAQFIANRYHLVTIGSGDHIFAPLATELRELGIKLTVVARSRRLSGELADAADQVIYLDPVVSSEAA